MTETWKPVGCYQNRGRALDKILFKFKRFGKMQKKYEQCVTKANQEGVTVFGLDDTRCWTGENAASSYGIYGTAVGRCGATKGRLRYGFLASQTVFVYQKRGGKLMGLHRCLLFLKYNFHSIIRLFCENGGRVTNPSMQ